MATESIVPALQAILKLEITLHELAKAQRKVFNRWQEKSFGKFFKKVNQGAGSRRAFLECLLTSMDENIEVSCEPMETTEDEGKALEAASGLAVRLRAAYTVAYKAVEGTDWEELYQPLCKRKRKVTKLIIKIEAVQRLLRRMGDADFLTIAT